MTSKSKSLFDLRRKNRSLTLSVAGFGNRGNFHFKNQNGAHLHLKFLIFVKFHFLEIYYWYRLSEDFFWQATHFPTGFETMQLFTENIPGSAINLKILCGTKCLVSSACVMYCVTGKYLSSTKCFQLSTCIMYYVTV